MIVSEDSPYDISLIDQLIHSSQRRFIICGEPDARARIPNIFCDLERKA